jgi:hypothetical protein
MGYPNLMFGDEVENDLVTSAALFRMEQQIRIYFPAALKRNWPPNSDAVGRPIEFRF